MRKLLTTRRRIAVVGAVTAGVLAVAGVAFAYFTSTGSGTGSASVGSAANFNVVQTGGAGTLYPCGSTTAASSGCSAQEATIVYTVTNEGTGAQQLTAANLSPAVDDSNGNGTGVIVTGGTGNATADPPSGSTSVTGCQATWFGSAVTAVNGGAVSNVDLAPHGQSGDSATVTVTVTMEDAATDQSLCEGHLPDVNLGVG